jgi:hypothetical protein
MTRRGLAVAAVDGLQQVGLLGLGGQAGGGAAALHVDHDQGQLGHHREADGLALEGHARAGGAGDTRGRRRRTRRWRRRRRRSRLRPGRSDAEVLERRPGVQDVGGRGDRVAAVEHGDARAARRRRTRARGGVAGDVPVGARREAGLGHLVAGLEQLDGLPRSCGRPAAPRCWRRGTAALNFFGLQCSTVYSMSRAVQPVHHAEREEVLAAVGLLGVEPVRRDGAGAVSGDRGLHDAEPGEGAVFQRVRVDPALARSPALNESELTMTRPPGLSRRGS